MCFKIQKQTGGYYGEDKEQIKYKARSIEFERGLRDKLDAGERTEVFTILKKYGVLENAEG